MATEKVQSFVGKFISLWAIGEEVSLTLNAKNGKAKVIMELDLGDLEMKNKMADDVKVSIDFEEKFPPIAYAEEKEGQESIKWLICLTFKKLTRKT